MMKNKNGAVCLMLILIALGSGILDYFVPDMGDDLRFRYFLGLDDYVFPDRRTLSFILGHMVGCNGRIFDFLGPVIIYMLPRVLASVVMGLMSGLFFYSIVKVSDIPEKSFTTLKTVTITAVMLLMPWWDSMFMRVCQFNYMWGTAFCLLFIYYFFKKGIKSGRCIKVMLFMLGVFAGGTHEQSGLAMTSVFGALIMMRYIKIESGQRRLLMAGLVAGTFIALSSPAIWIRVGKEIVRAPFLSLVATSFPVMTAMLVVVCICLLWERGRAFIKTGLHTSWGVLAGVSIVSGLIGVVSGIPGRTGFLSETCAVIVLVQMGLGLEWSIKRLPAILITVSCFMLVTVHFVVSINAQSTLYKEFEDVKREYIKSADGIVYYDFTTRYDVSPVTLYRVKGVADADDLWNLYVLREVYGHSEKNPVVLPVSMKGKIENFADSISCGDVTVYSHKPDNMIVTSDDVMLQNYHGTSPRVVTETMAGGKKKIWIATPLVCDPGDLHV